MKRLLAITALLASGCGELRETSADAEYLRGAFHLYLQCPGGTPQFRAEDLLYPLNFPGQTWKVEQDGSALSMTWDGLPIARGERTTTGISLDFERLDPYGATVQWSFEGQLRDDLEFHERTIVGRITSGMRDDCIILPNSVAWFTEGRRSRKAPIDPDADARARGWWSRFVWFLDIGPYGMSRKGDEGQRGRNLRMFSFAATGGGEVIAGDDGTFFDNGFGVPWPGAARGRAAAFDQDEDYWELEFEQDVIFDDRGANEDLGVHRVMAGFVGGDYRVVEQNYPFGWEGETGLLPLKGAGMAFWLDLHRAAPPPESAESALTGPVRVMTREEDPLAPASSPLIRLVDGEVVW